MSCERQENAHGQRWAAAAPVHVFALVYLLVVLAWKLTIAAPNEFRHQVPHPKLNFAGMA